MAEFADQIKKFFTLDKVDIDNWTFKLFSKISVGILLLSSALCIATTYFGSPIECKGHAAEDKFVLSYCWIHGSYHVDDKNKKLAEKLYGGEICESGSGLPEGSGDGEPDDTVDTAYYQWVVFMLFAHAVIFMIPNQLWRFMEGGLMESFGSRKENHY